MAFPVLKDYQITELLSSEPNFCRYRAYPILDSRRSKPYLIHEITGIRASHSDFVRFQIVYEKLASLPPGGVVKVPSLQILDDRVQIIYEEPQGKPWFQKSEEGAKWDQKKLLPLIKAAIQIAEGLAKLHAAGVYHGSLNPGSIFMDSRAEVLQLINIWYLPLLIHQKKAFYYPYFLHEWLPYLAPEQTGRMNRAPDFRVDFYSLGALLYEWLTGSPPFQSSDPMELIYCHMAQLPKAPREKVPAIPEVISELVMVLLSKNAEDRYESFFGLMTDLKTCLAHLQEHDSIPPFKLKQKDWSDTFVAPQKVYGRATELATLNSAAVKMAAGHCQMVMVAGEPGAGKSTLVREFETTQSRKGYFLSGKHDQFLRNRPYYAIAQAFSALIGDLLASEDHTIQVWKRKLSEALGATAQIIIETIPQLELILGKQPPLSEMGPAESRNRFHLAYQRFVDVFAQKEHPLTLYLDDLQWADSATLELVTSLMAESQDRYLLIMGAYRDNEVDASHLLASTLEELRKTGVEVIDIHLGHLKSSDVQDIINDILHTSSEESAPLVDLVYRKTEGNPLFVSQFLKAIFSDNLLTLDLDKGWSWDLAKISQLKASEDIVQLIQKRLVLVPADTLEVLKVAACIGSTFSFSLLCDIVGKDNLSILRSLEIAAAYGVILLPAMTGTIENFFFFHDRVHEAAYHLVPEPRREALHYQVGKLLSKKVNPGEEGRFFEIVNHLNYAINLLRDSQEIEELARFNSSAGKKAKGSNAHDAAKRFFTIAVDLVKRLDAPSLELEFEVQCELAECTFLCGDQKRAHEIFDDCLSRLARTPLQKAQVEFKKMELFFYMDQLPQAVDAGRKSLGHLGFKVEKSYSLAKLLWALVLTRWALRGRKMSDLAGPPVVSSPERTLKIKALNLLIAIALYVTKKDRFLNPCLALGVMQDVLREGNVPDAVGAYIYYGILTLAIFRDEKRAYEFGRLSMDLSEKYSTLQAQCAVQVMFYPTVLLRYDSFRETAVPLFNAAKALYEAGDFIKVGQAKSAAILVLVHAGGPLSDAAIGMQELIEFSKKIKNVRLEDSSRVSLQFFLNLMGKTKSRNSLNTEDFDEIEFEKNVELGRYSDMLICHFYNYKLKNLYLFCEFEMAARCISKGASIHRNLPGTWRSVLYYWYSALTCGALLPKASLRDRGRFRSVLKKARRRFKALAADCPINYLHMSLMIEAQIEIANKRISQGLALLESAAIQAKEAGFVHHAAIALERAGELCLGSGSKIAGRHYLSEAKQLYATWGAYAKVSHLDEVYPFLMQVPADTHQPQAVSPSAEEGLLIREVEDASAIATQLSVLDLTTVLKSSQILSEEISLKKLLSRLMRVVMENTGAQRGFFLQEEAGSLNIAAKETTGTATLALGGSSSVDEYSLPVVQYVRRTREPLLLSATDRFGNFRTDSYIEKSRPQSILCIPIQKKSELLGVLYLENSVAADVFTQDRLSILKLLTVQAAISIENATLYNSLEQKVEDRTAALEKAKRAIQSILDNLDQGFMTLDAKGVVQEGVSRGAYELFSTDPVNKNVVEVLGLDQKQVETFKFWIESIFEDLKLFDLLVNDGPKTYTPAAGKYIELTYRPIQDEAKKTIEKLILIATDKTQEQQLKAKAEAEANLVKRVIRLIKGRDGFVVFLRELRTQIEDLKMKASMEPERIDISELFRLLHTMRGNSASYCLDSIAEFANTFESQLAVIRDSKDRGALKALLPKLEGAAGRFTTLLNDFLIENKKFIGTIDEKAGRDRSYPVSQIYAFSEELEEHKGEPLSPDLISKFNEQFVVEPFASHFGKFESLVSDVAKSQGKEVEFRIRPSPVRLYVEPYLPLLESMVHAFRNAVDHGIELPEERVQANKPKAGVIEVSIELSSNDTNANQNIVIEISDDGRGIDPEIIGRLAVERGLADEAKIKSLSPEAIIQFVFAPGFSSKKVVTELSGRGVGLDAIQTAAAQLGGRAWVESVRGHGNKLKITAPLSVPIQKAKNPRGRRTERRVSPPSK